MNSRQAPLLFKRVGIPCALLLGLCGTACDDDPVTCLTVYQPGFIVTITDSLSGEPRSEIATAIVTDGAFVDTLVPYLFSASGEVAKAGAYERPGTYDLLVTAPGYLEYRRTGLQLTAGECHVRTLEVDARLMLDPSNNRPVMTELADTSAAVGDTLRLRATAEDADGDSLRYSLTVFISWNELDPDLFPSAGIDSRTGDLWFAPTPQDAPSRTLLVTVDDGKQGRDSTHFEVTIGQQNELERQREIWNALSLVDYDFELGFSCYCEASLYSPALVYVRGGIVDSLRLNPYYPTPGEGIASRFRLTIPDLFDAIEDAQARNADSIYVDYDSTMGYPRLIRVDETFGVADDEREWSAALLSTGDALVPERRESRR